MDFSPFVKVAILENDIEAQIVTAILQDRGIIHRVRSFHDTAYDGLFQFQKGWGEIYSPDVYKKEILAILNDIRTQNQNRSG